MTIQDIIALTKAGYTKADIALLAQAETKTEPKAEPKTEPKAEPKTEPKAEPKTEPKAEPKAEPVQQGMLSDAQFQQLLQTINASNASIDVPPAYDVKDVLASHFTQLMIGDKPEGGK